MRRGDYVIVALQGDHGKPRPALIIHNDALQLTHSIVVCPLTTTIISGAEPLRIIIEPNEANGLKETSQIMLDKITSISKSKIGEVIGHADETTMQRVSQGLMVLLKLM